jgi:hypothetical protein
MTPCGTRVKNSRVATARGPSIAALALGLALAFACGSDPCTGPQCGGSEGTGATGGTAQAIGTARSGPCASDAACDTSHGFSCTAGECRYPCRSHFDCEGQGICEPLRDDGGQALGTYCAFFEQTAPPGQYYTRCPNYDECDAEQPFLCLGSGVGDADAYCSADCLDDADCPTGFLCDEVSDSDGLPHQVCVRRRFCAPCETDADCLTVPGQVCARDIGGEKICTELCDPSVDSCPWGNASVCDVFDQELGVPTCAHRFGSCHGAGLGCEPCVRDADCPKGFCTGSSYTSERWCIDTSIDCNCDGLETSQDVCQAGNGCPRTPGDLKMMCYDNERFDGDPIAYSCFGANTTGTSGLASPQSGCWGHL